MTTPRILGDSVPDRATFAFDGSILVEQYDLMYHDSNDVKPASSQADQGTEERNQAAFAPKFAGLAGDTRLAADTDALTDFPVLTDVVCDMDCASATFEVGDLLTVDEASGGTALEDAKLVKTTNRELAIGYAMERHASAVTRVKCRLTSRVQPHGVGPVQVGAMLPGVGITGTADNYGCSVEKVGTLFKTTIVVDIDGLNSGGTANDIIGADGAGVAHLGQITAAKNGTIFAGRMTCLETPATGDDDIDLYSAEESTGVENTLVTALTETQLCNSGDLTNASIIPLTAFPAADEYLYLAGGTGDSEATYTAGILVIELWGK